MVKDSGKIISDRLHSSYHTCVLSTSGLDINTAKKSIPVVLEDRKNDHDLVVLHVGTNDAAQLSLNEMVNRFEKLIHTTKNIAPNHKIILNAVAKRLTPGSESINHKIDNVNKRIREMFEYDPNCFYVNCNSEQVASCYRNDGIHFSHIGVQSIAYSLTKFVQTNFQFLIPQNHV